MSTKSGLTPPTSPVTINALDPTGLVTCQTFVSGTLYYWSDTGRPIAFFVTSITTVCFGEFKIGGGNGGGGGGTRSATNAGTQGYTRPGRAECAAALAELAGHVKVLGDTLDGAMQRGGLDKGHQKKLRNLKNAMGKSLKKVIANCFNDDGTPRFPHLTDAMDAEAAIKTAEEYVNNPEVPPVGWRGPDLQTWKIAAAVASIGVALSTVGHAIWELVFGH